MGAVKDCSDSDREGARAISTLPPLITAIPARVPPNVFALAIGANRMAVPPRLFEVVNCLFIGLESLEKIEDVHGCTGLFDALPYLSAGFCQVHKRTIPNFFAMAGCLPKNFVSIEDEWARYNWRERKHHIWLLTL